MIVAPLSDGANRIVRVPGSLFVAVIDSRSETPSGPGFASRAATLEVSPFVASETVVTTMSDADRAAGAAADIAATRTSNAAGAAIFIRTLFIRAMRLPPHRPSDSPSQQSAAI